MDWSEGKYFEAPLKEVIHTKKAPLHNKLPENGDQYTLFTGVSHHILENHQKRKTAL